MAGKKIIGTFGIFFGLLLLGCCAVGLNEIISGIADGGTYGALIFFAGGAAFTLGSSVRMLKAGDEAPTHALTPGGAGDAESIVLALAARSAGRVTIAEVAANSSLTLDQATGAIATLNQRGMTESIVTEGGVVVYQVRGLLSAADKASARDILDT